MKTGPWSDSTLCVNGKEVQKNFFNWFEKSKVVDSKGVPLVVYHGTTSEIESFDKESIGKCFYADDRGFFFTSSPQTANEYTLGHGLRCAEGGNVVAAYISLQNPLIIDEEFLISQNMEVINVSDDCINLWDYNRERILAWADDRNADGVILVGSTNLNPALEPVRMVVAFEPCQIKSAVGNSGLYLPESESLSDTREALTLERANKAKIEIFKATRTLELTL